MSAYPNIPIDNPTPDGAAYFEYLTGKREQPARPPMVEYLVDDLLRRRIGEEMLGQTWAMPGDAGPYIILKKFQ